MNVGEKIVNVPTLSEISSLEFMYEGTRRTVGRYCSGLSIVCVVSVTQILTAKFDSPWLCSIPVMAVAGSVLPLFSDFSRDLGQATLDSIGEKITKNKFINLFKKSNSTTQSPQRSSQNGTNLPPKPDSVSSGLPARPPQSRREASPVFSSVFQSVRPPVSSSGTPHFGKVIIVEDDEEPSPNHGNGSNTLALK